MNSTIHLDATNEVAKKLTALAFPNYSGRKFKVQVVSESHQFEQLNTLAEGGSWGEYVLINLAHGTYKKLVSRGFECIPTFNLVENVILLEHSYFCGKDSGITIYVTSANAAQLLPAHVELTVTEKKVLEATRSFKSSYAGIKNYRQQESGLSLTVWNETVEILKNKGLLAKNGAITPSGRNAI